MISDHLTITERQEYLGYKSQFEHHCRTAHDVLSADRCSDCDIIVRKMIPFVSLASQRMNQDTTGKRFNQFKDISTEAQLDQAFLTLPGETRSAAAQLLNLREEKGEYLLKRFLTLAGSHQAFFPNGRRDVYALQDYAARRYEITSDPSWFGISMVCEDFGHRVPIKN